MDNEHLERIVNVLNTGQKPDLRDLTNFVTKNCTEISLGDWDELSRALQVTYKLSLEELACAFKSPLCATDSYVDDFEPIMPDCGWISDYVKYTRNIESPTAFHFFTALTVLGATLHRQVYVDQSHFKIWPAIQTMLIGPSGKVKKSTAANVGVRLAMHSNRINKLPERVTSEALSSNLAELYGRTGAAIGMLYVSELSTCLNKKDYNSDLVQVLTDLFDSRDIPLTVRTQRRGNETISNVAVSFIGCSNEEWLASSIPESAFGGGFMGRMLVIHQANTDRMFPLPEPSDPHLHEYLQSQLAHTEFVQGVAALTPAARKFFTKRYIDIKHNWPRDERVMPFWERLGDHLLRLGMVLSVSENLEQRNGVSITDEHLYKANILLDWILKHLPQVYGYLGRSEFGDEAHRILRFISGNGGVAKMVEIQRHAIKRISAYRLREILGSLCGAGALEQRLDTSDASSFDGALSYRLLRKIDEI